MYYTRNFAMHIDPAHKTEWLNLVSSKGIGLILRSITIDYKFVRSSQLKIGLIANTSSLFAAYDLPR